MLFHESGLKLEVPSEWEKMANGRWGFYYNALKWRVVVFAPGVPVPVEFMLGIALLVFGGGFEVHYEAHGTVCGFPSFELRGKKDTYRRVLIVIADTVVYGIVARAATRTELITGALGAMFDSVEIS